LSGGSCSIGQRASEILKKGVTVSTQLTIQITDPEGNTVIVTESILERMRAIFDEVKKKACDMQLEGLELLGDGWSIYDYIEDGDRIVYAARGRAKITPVVDGFECSVDLVHGIRTTRFEGYAATAPEAFEACCDKIDKLVEALEQFADAFGEG